jgi:hypothetical protein
MVVEIKENRIINNDEHSLINISSKSNDNNVILGFKHLKVKHDELYKL